MKWLYLSLFAFAILFSACRGGGNKGDQEANLVEAQGTIINPETGEEERIYYGGVFKVNDVEDFKSLYPHNITEVYSHHIVAQVYQGMLRLTQDSLKVEPCLAENYETNEDLTVWTFNLRRGVKFHDDPCFDGGKGREVTAHDFKFCLDKLCSYYSENVLYPIVIDKIKGAEEYYQSTKNGSPHSDGVRGIKVIDDYTLQIELNYPNAAFDKIITHPACWVFPKEALDKYGVEMRVHPVGTGPFRADKVREGELVILRKNGTYWEEDEFGNQLPYLDAIKYTFIKEKKTELLEFGKGNLDMVWKLPVEDVQFIMSEGESATDYNFQIKPALTTQYYGFQHMGDLFNNVDLRKAFNYAIDRESIVNNTLKGEGEPAMHGLVPGFDGYPQEKVKGYEFDPELARKHMAAAGYPNGRGFPELKLQINKGGSTNYLVAQNIVYMLKQNLNIDVEIEVLQGPAHFQRINMGQTDFWRTAWVADYPDPENFLVMLYGNVVPESMDESAYLNSMRYKSPKYDSLYEAGLREPNYKKRMDIFAQAEQVAMDDAAVMPIYYDEYIRLIKKNVRNFPQNNMEHRDFTRVFFAKSEEEAAEE